MTATPEIVVWDEQQYAVKCVPGGATLMYPTFEAAVDEARRRLADDDILGAKAIDEVRIEDRGATDADENGIAERVWMASRTYKNAVAERPAYVRIARRFVVDADGAKRIVFEAGRLDTLFRHRAIDDGRPFTTRPLIEGGDLPHLTELALQNTAGRAARYLSKSEIQRWLRGVTIANSNPNADIIMQYTLGCF